MKKSLLLTQCWDAYILHLEKYQSLSLDIYARLVYMSVCHLYFVLLWTGRCLCGHVFLDIFVCLSCYMCVNMSVDIFKYGSRYSCMWLYIFVCEYIIIYFLLCWDAINYGQVCISVYVWTCVYFCTWANMSICLSMCGHVCTSVFIYEWKQPGCKEALSGS